MTPRAISGVHALMIPARIEEIWVSPYANSVNGMLQNRSPTTARCRQTRRSRGSRVPVARATASSTSAPIAARPNATPIGESDWRPSLMNRNEQPQMPPRTTNQSCQGIARRVRMEG